MFLRDAIFPTSILLPVGTMSHPHDRFQSFIVGSTDVLAQRRMTERSDHAQNQYHAEEGGRTVTSGALPVAKKFRRTDGTLH